MTAGWRANLGRGVSALIARVDDQLHRVQLDANANIVHDQPSRDALLKAIRADGSITAAYRHAITNAAVLYNQGRRDEALAMLRDAPAHQDIATYFTVSGGTRGSDSAHRALSTAHDELDKFQALVNGDGEAPIGALGRQMSHARENPDVLCTRGLVQSVGAELFRIGAYSEVLATVRPPLPPRTVDGPLPKA